MKGIILQQLDVTELELLIRKIIKEELAIVQNRNAHTADDSFSNEPLISKMAAANVINVSLPTFSKMIKEGVIKTYKVGRRNKFKKAELIQSLQQSKTRRI